MPLPVKFWQKTPIHFLTPLEVAKLTSSVLIKPVRGSRNDADKAVVRITGSLL
jgi:hypothetical protein